LNSLLFGNIEKGIIPSLSDQEDILIVQFLPPLGGCRKSSLSLRRERVGVRVLKAQSLISITLILAVSLEGRRNYTFYDTLS